MPLALLVHTLVGTALVAGGAAALNQVLEHRTDALMRRTAQAAGARRAGWASPESAWFGVFLSVAGLGELWLGANAMAAAVAALTLLSYVLVYTPLKTRTSLSTLVGAVPGALPPVIGWSAATGDVTLPALVLFGIVFFWQMPHFLAIAWMYRDDYAQAGIPLLPVIEPDGRRTGQQALLYAAALWPVSLLPAVVGLAGWPYSVVATVLGLGFIGLSGAFARERSLRDGAPPVPLLDHLPAAAARRARRRSPLVVDRSMEIQDLPRVNATLNALGGRVPGRRLSASSAAAGSARTSAACWRRWPPRPLFLACYVVYHANAGSRPFRGPGRRPAGLLHDSGHPRRAGGASCRWRWSRRRAGLRQRLDAHVRIARWTLPIWLYVSVTGVVIYLMLYW